MSKDGRLEHILGQMEALLEKLKSACPEKATTPTDLPDRGVYAFYNEGKPLYVGRSNRLRQRVAEHGQPGAGYNKATFAYRLLAKKRGFSMGHDKDNPRRKVAEKYASEFREQKKCVRNMCVHAVEICDDRVAYFFEAYAIIALCTTTYNKFEPH